MIRQSAGSGRLASVAVALGALLGILTLSASPARAAQGPSGAATPDAGYIVLLESSAGDTDAATDALERRKGFRARKRFRRALRGFSARLSDAKAARLRADPEVASVTPDRPVKAFGEVDLLGGDSVPAGVRRVGAGAVGKTREASTANVAVIDSGIDLSHPDLNAVDGVNCLTPGAPAQDEDGHGTHVAGTIGARNDGRGVVGVAPGTRTYAVKVLNAEGKGYFSDVLCGIDWVTATRTDKDPTNDIAVANLSLGGEGDPVGSCTGRTGDPLHRAICASTRAGVTYVVAAGNDSWNFDSPGAPDLPAAFPEVLTVAAMSDSDGLPGGRGGTPSCRSDQGDDRYAGFSNYAGTAAGAAHTVAGPGVCVRSTWLGGGYATISGTSMAAPHLAGAVALCLGEGGRPGPCAGLSPAAIVAKMVGDAGSRALDAPAAGFAGDPACAITGRYLGFLGWSGLPGSVAAAEATPPDGAPCVPPVVKSDPTSATDTTLPGARAPAPAVTARPADRTAPAVSLSVPRQRLARVLSRGLRVSVRCSEECVAGAALWLPGRTARRVRLTHGKPKRIARAPALPQAARKPTTTVLEFSRAARRRLARVGRVTLRVEVSAGDAAGNRATASRLVTLRR